MKSIDEVLDLFAKEFSALRDRIKVRTVSLKEATESNEPMLNQPGVYVYWKESLGVIKVGKHQVNVRKRALEHLRDNTKNEKLEMCSLSGDPHCKLMLFTVEKEDIHWLPSLEAFLDKNTEPVIPSARIG